MYKDPAKQKQANKEAIKRFRANKAKKNAPESTTIDERLSEGITTRVLQGQGIPSGITAIPKTYEQETYRANSLEPPMQKYPLNYGLSDCTCKHCQQNRVMSNKFTINHGAYKPAEQLATNEVNRVSMPGDIDYDGICTVEWKQTHSPSGVAL